MELARGCVKSIGKVAVCDCLPGFTFCGPSAFELEIGGNPRGQAASDARCSVVLSTDTGTGRWGALAPPSARSSGGAKEGA